MNTILALPGMVVSIAMTLAAVAAFLGPHQGPPPSGSGVLTPAAEMLYLLERANKAQRRGTPYGSLALAKLVKEKPHS